MKFENKYPSAKMTDKFPFEYSFVTKGQKLGRCHLCNCCTRWLDLVFQLNVCSEECDSAMWKRYKEDDKTNSTHENFETHFGHVKEELILAKQDSSAWKDILVVVHNQLDYLKTCIESIKANTKNFHLYIWDNGSSATTAEYLKQLMSEHNPELSRNYIISLIRSETNRGFIEPNNELIAMGESEYVVLLNSDTKVFEGWDRALVGFLKNNPDVGQVGYFGGHLDQDGRGFGGENGYDIDYIPGWCFCISRKTYEQFGLFNSELKFAYCEDADFSLRLKQAGKKIYALYAPLVHHYQNKTVIEVEQEGKIDLRSSFDYNHQYLKSRWATYLESERVVAKRQKT